MRILMLSWRSPAHPQAGGAETLTDDALRRWAAEGHEVTWFSGAFPGGADEEVVGGVRHIRRGRQWTVHLQAWRWLRRHAHEFDRIIDQINTIPFFTPAYVAPERRRFLIFQLAREYWFRETRGLFRLAAPFGYILEPRYLRAYRRTRGATICESTRQDLARCGVPPQRVALVPVPLTVPTLERLDPKPEPFTVIMVGRLTQAKFVEEGVRAFARVQRDLPDARLVIVGSGDPAYRRELEELVAALRLRDVEFTGRVSEERRQALMAEATVHLFASHREGWGLTVSEAGAAGTPSVGYDAPGVRESVADPARLAPIGDIEALAERVLALARDPGFYAAAREDAWRRARELSPERTAHDLMALLS